MSKEKVTIRHYDFESRISVNSNVFGGVSIEQVSYIGGPERIRMAMEVLPEGMAVVLLGENGDGQPIATLVRGVTDNMSYTTGATFVQGMDE